MGGMMGGAPQMGGMPQQQQMGGMGMFGGSGMGGGMMAPQQQQQPNMFAGMSAPAPAAQQKSAYDASNPFASM